MKIDEYPSVQLKRRAQAVIARETATLTIDQEVAYYRRHSDSIRRRLGDAAKTSPGIAESAVRKPD